MYMYIVLVCEIDHQNRLFSKNVVPVHFYPLQTFYFAKVQRRFFDGEIDVERHYLLAQYQQVLDEK